MHRTFFRSPIPSTGNALAKGAKEGEHRDAEVVCEIRCIRELRRFLAVIRDRRKKINCLVEISRGTH